MMNLPTLPSIDVLKTITPKEKINRKKKKKKLHQDPTLAVWSARIDIVFNCTLHLC